MHQQEIAVKYNAIFQFILVFCRSFHKLNVIVFEFKGGAGYESDAGEWVGRFEASGRGKA